MSVVRDLVVPVPAPTTSAGNAISSVIGPLSAEMVVVVVDHVTAATTIEVTIDAATRALAPPHLTDHVVVAAPTVVTDRTHVIVMMDL